MGGDLPPVGPARVGDRRRDEPEVGRVTVRADEEEVAVVFQVVLVVLLACGDQPEGTPRIAGREVAHLGGRVARRGEEDVALAGRAPGAQLEPLVLLLVYQLLSPLPR